jgi:hypothetical protein
MGKKNRMLQDTIGEPNNIALHALSIATSTQYAVFQWWDTLVAWPFRLGRWKIDKLFEPSLRCVASHDPAQRKSASQISSPAGQASTR